MEMTGGQALARQLAKEGVTDIFGVPGVQLDWAIDGLMDVSDRITYRTPRHEQATAYMADGYARTTGRMGVAMVVPGPGLLNAMTGLSTAFACSSPVMCIAGHIPSHTIGQGFGMLHEVRDQSEILSKVTKWNGLARKPEEIPALVRRAVDEMHCGQPRPVGLEVPPDVLQAKADIQLLEPQAPPAPERPDGEAVKRAAQALREARFPVIVAGGGVLASGASAALQRLAEAVQAPVVMTENGQGALSDRHALALTSLGGRAALPHADVVLVVGSRFMNVLGKPLQASPGTAFVYLNIDETHTAMPRQAGTALVTDAAIGLEALADELGGWRAPSRSDAAGQVKRWCDEQLAFIEPQLSWVRALREAIPDDGVLVNELTQVGYLATLAYPVVAPRTFLTPGYQGTLGYGFATGLGVAAGNPGRTVVSINGDGGFGWNLQELATAAKYRLNLITVVFVDGAFGNVRRIQQRQFGRGMGTDLHNPDFCALASAFGVASERIESPQALAGAIRAASSQDGPVLLEVPVGEMPSPWHLIHSFSPAPRPAPPNPLGTAVSAAGAHA